MIKDIENNKELRSYQKTARVSLCGYNEDTVYFYVGFGRDSGAERDDIAQAMIAKDKHRVTRLESWNTASEDQDPKDCPSVYVVVSTIPNDEEVTIEKIKERLDLLESIYEDWIWRNEETIKRRIVFWEKHKDDWP